MTKANRLEEIGNVRPVVFKLVNWMGKSAIPRIFLNKELLTKEVMDAINKDATLLIPLLYLFDRTILKRFTEMAIYQSILVDNRFVFSGMMDSIELQKRSRIHNPKLYPSTPDNVPLAHLNAIMAGAYNTAGYLPKMSMKEMVGWEFEWSGD